MKRLTGLVLIIGLVVAAIGLSHLIHLRDHHFEDQEKQRILARDKEAKTEAVEAGDEAEKKEEQVLSNESDAQVINDAGLREEIDTITAPYLWSK